MEKNENLKKKQTDFNSDSFVIVNHEDSKKNEAIANGDNIIHIKNSLLESNSQMITYFPNNEKEFIHLIKFLYKVKKHLMNFLGNLKQDLEFYTIIRENIDSVISRIEGLVLFYNKIFLSLKSKQYGIFSHSEINCIITCYLKLGELLNFIFQIYSNNIFLKLSILFFDKIHKSFITIKSPRAKQLISALLYESMVRFTDIIVNKKIEFIDKFKDSKINYNLIKTINKILDFINFKKIKDTNKNHNNYNNNNSSKSEQDTFPNITDIFNYLLISRTNIFSLNAYFLFDDFSKVFYQIIKKLISAIKNFNILPEKYEEVKAMLNINLFKLLEISRIKDDLKNSIEDSQHEFYLDSLNLYIKITKLIIKNFYNLEILADDSIKDKICRFLIELSFWDSLDVVDNTCKFFLLIWKIAEKHKIFMRSEIEKIIDFLFLRRFKLFISLLNDQQEESLVKLSVLEILVNYLIILVRDYNFVYLVYLNFDFCKIRFNLLIEILASCQKYFELSFPVYSHLKSIITTLYLSIFEILHEVIINGNFGENGINYKISGACALDFEEEENKEIFDDSDKFDSAIRKEKEDNLPSEVIVMDNEKFFKSHNVTNNNTTSINITYNNKNVKDSKHAKKIKNKHCVTKKLKNTFASDLEESEVERKKNDNNTAKTTGKLRDLSPDMNNNNLNAKNNFCSESSEIEEEDNDYDVAEQQQNATVNQDSESNEVEQIKREELNSKLILDIHNNDQIKAQDQCQILNQNPNNPAVDSSLNINNNSNKIQNHEEPKNKFNVDFNFIKEIQNLQDLWNDEILLLVNLPSFKKFNNKICPLFGLSPIETVHKKKGSAAKAEKAKETIENNPNSISSSSISSSENNEDAANSSFVSNNSNSNNSLSINVEIDSKSDKAEKAESNNAFEIISTIEGKTNNEGALALKKNEEKIFNTSASIMKDNINGNNKVNSNDNKIKLELESELALKQKSLDAQRALNYRKFAYSIAVMLKYSYYVDIEKLHEIFGNKNDLSKLILEEYLNTFDFRGLDILKAYRIYVSTFKLTGESDNIYNMIMAFSEKYHHDNPNDSNLRSSDEVSTLAYSILMLNTDLHDPNIKEHMSLEEFIKNVYSTRYFDHIARSYLENIYKSILTNPFKVPSKRSEDYNKADELFEVLRSKRNLVRNRQVFWENAKQKKKKEYDDKAIESCGNGEKNAKEDEEEISKNLIQNYEAEVFISNYDTANSQKFLFEILNFEEDTDNTRKETIKENEKFNCLEIPKIKRSLNFSLFNLCENFNNLDHEDSYYSKEEGVISVNTQNHLINQKTRNKVLSAVYYMLWEDVYYNFMEISSKFYERKDENVNKIFDKICVIADKLNKKDYIHKLIMQVHSLINSGKYEKRNLAQLYNIFFSISINYSKNFNSYLEIYFSSILDIIKHKIFKNESDLQEDYKRIIEAQINKSFSVIDNKRNKKIQSSGLFSYLFTRNTKEAIESGLNKYREHILNHLKISEALTPSSTFDEDFFELGRILEIIRNQDEEFIFFVSLAASKILDYNSKAEHYYSLIFLNEILNENLNEKEFIKIWQNLFNIFINKMEFKHLFDKEENLFEILFFNFFFNLIIKRFSNLIETEDYIQLLSIYLEIENNDILFYFMENNDILQLNENNILDCDRNKFAFGNNKNKNINDILIQDLNKTKNSDNTSVDDESIGNKSSDKNLISTLNQSLNLKCFNSKLIKKDTCIEYNILLLFKLINYYATAYQAQKSDLNLLQKLKDSFKFLYRVISNITSFSDISLDTLTYIHNTFKLLQEENFVCLFISQKNGANCPESFYRIVESIIPRLLTSLPSIDDQKWHFFLSVLNTLVTTLLIEEGETQVKSFAFLAKMFYSIKIPAMILKEVLNIFASYFNGMRLCNFKHAKYWIDLFTIFDNLIKANEDLLNNENEMGRLWQIYVKGFVDNYRQTKKIDTVEKENLDYQTRMMLKETLNFVYNKVKAMDKSPNWWEANKNYIRLYFSDLIVFSN